MARTDLAPQFASLLMTWHLRPGVVPMNHMESLARLRGDARQVQALEYERRYGDGHYDERKELLSTVIALLAGNPVVDVEAVHSSLLWAKRVRGNVSRVWSQRTEQRKVQEEIAKVRRHLPRWVARAARLYDRLGEHDPYDEIGPVLYTLEQLLRADPLMNQKPRKAAAKRAQGRPDQPWMDRVRKRLARAGVRSAETREELLMAVGLTPYRTPAARDPG